MPAYPVYDVTDWYVLDIEPEGDDPKYWLLGAAGEPDERPWLFKYATMKEVPVKGTQGAATRPYRQGEDWAEKVCSELANLIGVPAARVELASRYGRPGLLSRDIRPPGWQLNGGGVRIAEIDGRYAPKTSIDKRHNRIGHTLSNVRKVLNDVHPCPGLPASEISAWDIFGGYLLFDAWVANRDRHEHNWALLADPRGALHLSPSFDHAAGLGSGLEDRQRSRLLSDSDGVVAWCRAGTAHRFEDCDNVALTTLAVEALQSSTHGVLDTWRSNVIEIAPSEWQNILNRVPFLSEVSRTFISEVLRINQERIRDEFISATSR